MIDTTPQEGTVNDEWIISVRKVPGIHGKMKEPKDQNS